MLGYIFVKFLDLMLMRPKAHSVKTFVVDFESLSDSKKLEIVLYGDSRCDDNKNNSTLSASINYIKKT